MSKGLKALEYLKENRRKHWLDNDKSAESLETIEKHLKALEIIRAWLKYDYFVYFKLEEDSICIDGSSYLPKEEYELLKEVLE